jgi:DNA-binding PadR family transcriptional regulator
MELSKTAYVILGMLRSGRVHSGYDIKAAVESSTRFFWAASYGQIYPELGKLEAAGLIEGVDDPQGERRRRAYRLTSAGERALQDWLGAGSPLHFELRHEGLLRFFFADALGPEQRIELLRTIRAEHERVRDQLQAIEPAARAGCDADGISHPLRTLEFGIAYQDFIVDWCEETARRIGEEQQPATTGRPA